MSLVFGRGTFLGELMDWYQNLWSEINYYGSDESPRGLATKEVTNARLSIALGETAQTMRFNPAIGIIEGMSILGGRDAREYLAQAAPKTVAEGWFDGPVNYGTRVGTQLLDVVSELSRTPNSRRAVVHIGHGIDVFDASIDGTPCIQWMQFLIRDDKLHMSVQMRSWDIGRGLPSDIMIFNILGIVIARVLDLELGRLVVNAGSMHIYETDQFLQQSIHTGLKLYMNALGRRLTPTINNWSMRCRFELSTLLKKPPSHWSKRENRWDRLPNWLTRLATKSEMESFTYESTRKDLGGNIRKRTLLL